MANDRNYQRNKQGVLTSLKVYISIVSILGSYLKLLQVAFASCLPSLSLLVRVRLLPRVILVFISISTSFTVSAYSILVGFVRKFCMMCLHVQFLRICAHFLTCIGYVPTYLIPGGYVHNF